MQGNSVFSILNIFHQFSLQVESSSSCAYIKYETDASTLESIIATTNRINIANVINVHESMHIQPPDEPEIKCN